MLEKFFFDENEFYLNDMAGEQDCADAAPRVNKTCKSGQFSSSRGLWADSGEQMLTRNISASALE